MQRVSLRTLVLLLELLVAVSALQYLAVVRPARTTAVWLAGNDLVAAPAGPAETNDAATL
jgi:hypothetical protein